MGNIPTLNNSLGFNGIVNDSLPQQGGPDAKYTVMIVTVTSADPNAGMMLLNSDQGLKNL